MSIIMRHEAQLRQVAEQIQQANTIIDGAKKGMESAAADLAANWEGAARDAFVEEQLNTKTWLEMMIQIIQEMVSTINKINSSYTDVDQKVKDLINNH